MNIFLNKWKPGDKILSAQQLAIKFGVSLPTVKKEIINFKKNNILTSQLREGFFVNKNLYSMVPLSIRKRYDIECYDVNIEQKEKSTFLIKKYKSKKIKKRIWVESNVYSNVFKYNKYDKTKTFMYNFAINGIVINEIKSYFKIKNVKNSNYLVELRELIDTDNVMVVQEIIYIPCELWFQKEQFKF